MPDTYWSVTTPAGDFDLVQGAIIAERDEVGPRDVMQHMHAMIDVLAESDQAKIARAAAQALAELNAEEADVVDAEPLENEEETMPEDPSGVLPEGGYEDAPEEEASEDSEEWAPPGMRWLDGVLVPLEVPDDEARALAEKANAEPRVESIEVHNHGGSDLERIADALEATAAAAVLALDMPEDVKERADAIMTRWLGKAQPR